MFVCVNIPVIWLKNQPQRQKTPSFISKAKRSSVAF